MPLLTPSSRQTFAQDAPERLRAATLVASTITLGRPSFFPLAEAQREAVAKLERVLDPNGPKLGVGENTLDEEVQTIQ